MDKIKPQIFIASSVEGLPVADAINLNLDHDAHCTLWRTDTFRLSSSAIDDLVKKSSVVDFAIFVFTPDDAIKIRNQTVQTVRDNVIFELGLFIGGIGKERCYIVHPRGIELHLPSDLLGMTAATYAVDRPDSDIASALNAACTQIRIEINSHGPIRAGTSAPGAKQNIANPPDYILNNTDLLFLAECADSHISFPGGYSFGQIQNALVGSAMNAIRLSAIKLVRLGYIDKFVSESQNYNDGEYYAYTITEDGLDMYLKNEAAFEAMAVHKVQGNRATRPTPNFSDMDDDIPF